MQVSFGRIIQKSENKNGFINANQRWIMDRITSSFGYSDVEFAYGKDEFSGKELTFDQFLGRKKGVDVEVTAKRNGKVSIRLTKNLKAKDGIVVAVLPVKNQYGQVLADEFSTKSLADPIKHLTQMISKFRKRCIHWAMHK